MAAISDFVESIRSKKEIVDLVDVGDDVRLGMENEIVERPPDEFCQVRLYKTVPFSDFPPNCALRFGDRYQVVGSGSIPPGNEHLAQLNSGLSSSRER